MRRIRWCHPFYHIITGGSTATRNLPIFGISKLHPSTKPTNDSPPLQSDKHWEGHTRPIRCAESRGAIGFIIAPLLVVLQPEFSPFLEFQNSAHIQKPTFNLLQLQSDSPWGSVLDLLDALNLVMPFVSLSTLWLWLCRQECARISEF